jgi:tripartite motif-containing protein 2/3
MFHLADVSGMAPIIIETVSIEIDDFSDSFLTCGTCMQLYDGLSHAPKLLPCSHTICLSCAARSIEDASAATCCPVCSRPFTVPVNGVASLPASFVVNQLLDLVASGRRRDVLPKCAVHVTSELLFCETCDTVFCAVCDATGSGVHTATAATASAAHTVVPFAVAIRRVSEILQYKSAHCIRNLDAAAEAVELEMRHLDDAAEQCIESVNQIFAELSRSAEIRKEELVSHIQRTVEDKKQALTKHLNIVESEREWVDHECKSLPPDVRSITARIGNLNERMNASLSLAEPRENAFMIFQSSGMANVLSAVQQFGDIRVSETFPALCTVSPPEPPISVHLISEVAVITRDQYGRRRTSGGDTVSAELTTERGERVALSLCDNDDGTYDISFTPVSAGLHVLVVKIFDRIINGGFSLSFTVNAFHEPVAVYSYELRQPVAVCVDRHDQLYVLDTGNNRISVFDVNASMHDVSVLKYITSNAMDQRGATGIWLCASHTDDNSTFVIANWRSCCISEISQEGAVLRTFTCSDFQEPTSVAVGRDGTIFVADNAAGTIFVFKAFGQPVRKIGFRGEKPGTLGLMTSIYASSVADEMLVCDHRVQAFSYDGSFLYMLPPGDAVGRGQYGGVAIDAGGRYLVSRSEKGRAIVQVFDRSRRWQFSIDCGPSAKMRRPSGLAVDGRGHVYVADLGNGCVRKFRYI